MSHSSATCKRRSFNSSRHSWKFGYTADCSLACSEDNKFLCLDLVATLESGAEQRKIILFDSFKT